MKEEIFIDCSLPINLGYEDAIKVDLKNPAATRISSAALEFHPYFVFEYNLDITRRDPLGGSHAVKSEGICIIDASSGRFLSTSTGIDSTYHIKSSKRIENFKTAKDEEIQQIIIDLKTIEPELNRKMILNIEYDVNIIDDKIPLKGAERKALENAVSENTQKVSYYIKNHKDRRKEQKITITPRFSEIILNRRSRIYVPSWIITIKASEKTCNRKALAASNTSTVDEIYFCPKHFSLGKIWRVRKQTSAVCEICGVACCDDHIFEVDNSYYCEKHRPPI
jgi:hypothetical protein